ncbi:MAG: head GIN domain-containing protein, partial [Candidatus Humimicrobiaceae bacterium]
MNKKMKMFLKFMGILSVVAVILVMATSCIRFTGFSGSGNVITEERNVQGFNSIAVNAGINLFVEQGSEESVKIEAEDNVIPMIITEVKNGKLEIRYKQFFSIGFSPTRAVNAYVTVKQLNELKASSGSSVKTEEINTDSLKINMSSGAFGEFIIKSKEVEANASSGTLIRISGTTDKQDVKLSSGGSYDAQDLISKSADVDVSSGASAKINVSENLDVNISSGGIIQ